MKTKFALPKGTKVPDHLVIIPDGNRRWARARGKPTVEGHKEGSQRFIELVRAARAMGIHTITGWGLSTENWRERPKHEVEFLFKLMAEELKAHLKEARRDGVRIVHLGRKDRMPEWFLAEIAKTEKETEGNKNYIMNLALDYNGRDEMLRAINKILNSKFEAPNKTKIQNLNTKISEITMEMIEANLDTAGQPYPYPDLIIRTSGEQRTSGILMWQAEYAELYFEQENFPDFTVEKFTEAILDYSRRRRRFGGNDAVEHLGFRPEVVAKLELAWWRIQQNPDDSLSLSEKVTRHLKEQYGLSKKLAKETAEHLVDAIREGGKGKNWEKAKRSMAKFYTLLKQELGYAFEPRIVAGLELRWIKETEAAELGIDRLAEIEATAKSLYAEVYRISLLQAAKAAHLRAMAAIERGLAVRRVGDPAVHWAKAEEYLVRFYRALKERVA